MIDYAKVLEDLDRACENAGLVTDHTMVTALERVDLINIVFQRHGLELKAMILCQEGRIESVEITGNPEQYAQLKEACAQKIAMAETRKSLVA